MHTILASSSINISELKKNPSAIINEANGKPVVILNHNRPTAYLLPAATFEAIMERLDDIDLARLVCERQDQASIKVALDEI